MKPPFLLSLAGLTILCHSFVYSQTVATGSTIGNQKVISVPIGTGNAQALLWLPDDYNANPTKRYPLLIWLHTAAEATNSDITQVLNTGLPQLISQGLKPYGIDPVTGDTVKYIIVSPHAANSVWSYQYTHVKNILTFIKANYRADANRVIISGASAGGYGTWTFISDAGAAWLKANITAIVPMSTAELEADRESKLGANAVGGDVAIWAFCGTNDSRYNKAKQYQSLVQAKGPTKPNVLVSVTGVAHTSAVWNPPYALTYTGFNGKNLWSRMLDYTRSQGQPAIVNAGADQLINLPATTISLAGTAAPATGSTIASYSWIRVSGPNTPVITSSSAVSSGVTGLVQGTYVFRLSVTTSQGISSADDRECTACGKSRE